MHARQVGDVARAFHAAQVCRGRGPLHRPREYRVEVAGRLAVVREEDHARREGGGVCCVGLDQRPVEGK